MWGVLLSGTDRKEIKKRDRSTHTQPRGAVFVEAVGGGS